MGDNWIVTYMEEGRKRLVFLYISQAYQLQKKNCYNYRSVLF